MQYSKVLGSSKTKGMADHHSRNVKSHSFDFQAWLEKYFDSIDSKLSFFENLEDAPMQLEPALWK
jgi:hypothetical protein